MKGYASNKKIERKYLIRLVDLFLLMCYIIQEIICVHIHPTIFDTLLSVILHPA